ncbi:MAG: hypothetical protein IJF90_02735, partial [Synergistaceae bacterium]|nr:hypothetical protein [Synergistaceae bacterium]
MDSITKAGLLLNAVNAPHTAFTRLCSEHDPDELWKSGAIWHELGLTGRMMERLSGYLSTGWAEKEDERIYAFGAR